jgi:hypothetical protein
MRHSAIIFESIFSSTQNLSLLARNDNVALNPRASVDDALVLGSPQANQREELWEGAGDDQHRPQQGYKGTESPCNEVQSLSRKEGSCRAECR